MSGHICGVCFQDADLHPEVCDCDYTHWPALCCAGCQCKSYETAHQEAAPIPGPSPVAAGLEGSPT